MRHLFHIPRRALKALAYAVVLGILLFFALTRTEVGRDGLRRQIEQSFAERFEGRLRIGRLTGNLVNDLYARDVRLFDPDGRVVLAVDSVVARPRWRDLLQRNVSVGALTLYRPRVHLLRMEDGTWNASLALGAREPDTTRTAEPWSFTSTRIRVVDGVVTTRNLGDLPEAVAAGRVFDYTSARAEAIRAEATVDWGPAAQIVDLLQLSAEVPGRGARIDALQGQLVREDSLLALNHFFLETGGTRLGLTARLERPDLLGTDPGAVVLDLDLAESRIDPAGLRPFLPRFPLADTLALAIRGGGPLGSFVLEEAALASGGSVATLRGTVLGYPDSLDVDLACEACRLDVADVASLWPEAADALPAVPGPLDVDLTGYGVVRLGRSGPPSFESAARFTLGSPSGGARGEVSVGRDGRRWRYEADLRVDSLDIGRLADRPDLRSRLAGRLVGGGEGTRLQDLAGDLRLDLDASLFAGRLIDTLHVEAAIRDGLLRTTALLFPAGGRLDLAGEIDLAAPVPAYRAELAAAGVDLGPVLLSDSLTTDLNARLRVDGRGLTWEEVRGSLTVAFDSSVIRQGARESLVAPHETRLQLAATDGGPLLLLDGDFGELRVDGDGDLTALRTLAPYWAGLVAEAVEGVIEKPYAAGAAAPSPLSAVALLLAERARTAFDPPERAEPDSTAAVDLHAVLSFRRSDLLAALVPALGRLGTDLSADLTVRADPRLLRLHSRWAADSLAAGGYDARGLRLDLDVDARRTTGNTATLLVTATANGDTLRTPGPALAAPALAFRYDAGHATLTASTRTADDAGALDVAATLDVLPDRNRLTLGTLRVEAGGFVWENPAPGLVDLYHDAAVLPGFYLVSRDTASGLTQRVGVRGTLSGADRDTVVVDVDNIHLRQLSLLAAVEPRIGGVVDGQLSLTGGTRQPELTGTLRVAALSLENRLLGDLALTSRYVPGRPDIALDARLRPRTALPDTFLLPGTRIPAVDEGSRLHLGGTFRLPRYGPGRRMIDPGALDLSLQVDSARAFFFEFIFPDEIDDVRGTIAGRGAVRGDFRRPRFDAAVTLEGGQVRIPAFNLVYAAEGPAHVDDEGIHLDGVRVTDPTGGRAAVEGVIAFNEYRYFSFDLRAALDELQVMNVLDSRDLSFYGQIWGSGTATLTGPISSAFLRSADVRTSARSEVFIPLTESEVSVDPGFVVFADSAGRLPDFERIDRRPNVLADRPVGERSFLDGLGMDLNLFAEEGTTVHLVIDPLLGDVINAVGSGRIQLQRSEGEYTTYGTLNVDAGDYLFTAGEVFVRRFLIDEGSITWDGDPTNAQLDLFASYRTRASRAGLDLALASQSLIPVVVQLHITGRVETPLVDLSLAVDRSDRSRIDNSEGLEVFLNQPDRSAQYATSVLLTNSFLLTTSLSSSGEGELATTRNQLAFNSLSQLVASQLNRYISQALPNLDLSFGVQGESTQDLDITYGLALRLLDERLVIRGQGVLYQNDETRTAQQGIEGEFVVEVRLNPNVSVEVFYRREGDVLVEQAFTSTTGAGLSYQTRFPSWRGLIEGLFGWFLPDAEEPADAPPDEAADETADAGR